jgi:hypothetical protein
MTTFSLLNTVDDLDFSGRGLGPTITIDPLDRYVSRLAALTGLVHYLDARSAIGVKVFNSRGGDRRKQFQWTSDDMAVVASDPAYNGYPVFNFTDDDCDMVGPLGTPTSSYTVIAICDIQAARLAGNVASFLAATYSPEIDPGTSLPYGGEIAIQYALSADVFSHSPEVNTGGNALNVAQAVMTAAGMAGDTPCVLAVSYDGTPASGSRSSRIYLNDGLNARGSKTNHTQGPRVGPTTRWAVGWNQFGVDTGWVGRIARMIILPQAVHANSQALTAFSDVVEAAKDLFGIA